MSKITNAQKVATMHLSIERVRSWLFTMGLSKEERIWGCKAIIKYCQGFLKAEEVSHDADKS